MFSFLDRWSVGNLDAEIKTIVNEFHWSPNQIDELYCDDLDHHGIVYWFEHLKSLHAKMNKK
ncbi:hypothetical protein Phi47:1_gp24 [Cellulophaga phage phi47:1]|uniref:hypothetical protein n=1 Tax=Cellulophaga phage phiSM TaxID=756280 RepID=UPI0002B797CF|nr:hypothetical protein CEPG_00023 [Cellulophaga phage phiSM]AGF91178.1 hypothetical protein CHPG_00026 [Cellulophaga phage phi3:1]AGF91646.1 hypothetical protein CDPG_00042 [Cellulophaga phage phi47:1]AGO47755.1 hypothetical protein Phi3ST:2_gp24 [Cellulophaga phage phi3ST:2]AGO49263.1 hypothetical protein Phi38:2_gp24 [Cellulophaga phage phi38:2]AGH07771.1 hypothetical protein CEPG_00023 [Cellulophaga phage phiSM]